MNLKDDMIVLRDEMPETFEAAFPGFATALDTILDESAEDIEKWDDELVNLMDPMGAERFILKMMSEEFGVPVENFSQISVPATMMYLLGRVEGRGAEPIMQLAQNKIIEVLAIGGSSVGVLCEHFPFIKRINAPFPIDAEMIVQGSDGAASIAESLESSFYTQFGEKYYDSASTHLAIVFLKRCYLDGYVRSRSGEQIPDSEPKVQQGQEATTCQCSKYLH